MSKKLLSVEGASVTVVSQNGEDFISLTDMVRNSENGGSIIENWLRNKNTLEFLAVWEEIYNPAFNSLEFEGIKSEAGLNRFAISVKQWIANHASQPDAKETQVIMEQHANIYIAGHSGLVRSALMRRHTNPPSPASGGGAGGEGPCELEPANPPCNNPIGMTASTRHDAHAYHDPSFPALVPEWGNPTQAPPRHSGESRNPAQSSPRTPA